MLSKENIGQEYLDPTLKSIFRITVFLEAESAIKALLYTSFKVWQVLLPWQIAVFGRGQSYKSKLKGSE